MAPQLVRHKQRPPFGGVVKRKQTIVPNLRGGDVCTHNMVPAAQDTLVGFRPANHPTNSFGSLVPETLGGLNIWQFTVSTTTNTAQIQLDDGNLTGGQRIPGSTSVTIGYELGVVGLTWNGTLLRYDTVDADFSAYLQSQIGQDVCLRLSIQRVVPNNYSVEWDTDLIDESNELAAPFTITNNGTVPGTFEYEAIRIGGTFPIASGFVDIDEGQSASLTEDVSFLADGTIRISTRGTNAVGTGVTVFDDVTKDTGQAPEFPGTYRSTITINQTMTSQDLTNFPVLIQAGSLPNACMQAGGPQAAQPDGRDMRFSLDINGTQLLDHEVVSFDQNAVPSIATAEMWVRVPLVTAAVNTTIYAWWGRPGADFLPMGDLWADYDHVFHMENASGVSSTGSLTMVPLERNPSSMDTAGPSLFGSPFGGLSGVDDASGMLHPDPAPASLLPSSGPVHISCIFQRQNTVTFYVYEDSAGTAGGMQQLASNNEMRLRIDQNGGGGFTFLDTQTTFPQGHPITVSHCQFETGQRGYQYVNGVDDTDGTPSVIGTSWATTTRFVIGNTEPNLGATGGCGPGGLIDEFRVRAEIMSPAWIAAENAMYRNSTAFITSGPVQTP